MGGVNPRIRICHLHRSIYKHGMSLFMSPRCGWSPQRRALRGAGAAPAPLRPRDAEAPVGRRRRGDGVGGVGLQRRERDGSTAVEQGGGARPRAGAVLRRRDAAAGVARARLSRRVLRPVRPEHRPRRVDRGRQVAPGPPPRAPGHHHRRRPLPQPDLDPGRPLPPPLHRPSPRLRSPPPLLRRRRRPPPRRRPSRRRRRRRWRTRRCPTPRRPKAQSEL